MFLVPLGVLGNLWLSWAATDHDVLRSLHELPRRYLLLAVGLGLVPWLTNTLRILIWARFIGAAVSFLDVFRITLGAELASSVFPTSSGGEAFRWGMMIQKGITPGQAASIVTLGYLEDLLFFATAIPLSIYLSSAWELPVLQRVAAELQSKTALVAIVGFLLVLSLWILARVILLGRLGALPRRRGRRFAAGTRRRFRKTGRDFRDVYRLVVVRGKLRFLLTFLITAVQWSCRYSVVTALAYFLGAEVDPVLFFLLQWVIFTMMLFVPTPGASGGAEAIFFLVYSALLPARILGVATAGWRMLTFYVQLSLGSLIFVLLNVWEARTRARQRSTVGAR